jgi:hypothetical protein
MQLDSAVVWMLLLIEPHHRSPVGQVVDPVNRRGTIPPCEPPGITSTLDFGKPPPTGGHDEYQAVQPHIVPRSGLICYSRIPRCTTRVNLGVRQQ